MRKLKALMILSVFFCIAMACNSSEQRRKTDDTEMPIDTTNIDSMGNDTRGAGDGKGSDHTEDIP